MIASGGIATTGDLVVLAEVAASGANLEGSIVGKDLYVRRLTLPDALEAMRRAGDPASASSPPPTTTTSSTPCPHDAEGRIEAAARLRTGLACPEA